jgi:flavin reductase (DIM6/NTAB) family NADH-FMN oxidoreductase RutF
MLKPFPLSDVYQLLEPGPVVLLTTAHKGRTNVMAMSWHMMVEFQPPQVACIVSGANHSFTALRRTGEAVLAIPTADLAGQVARVGNCSGRDTDKFAAGGLTPVSAGKVSAPLVAECYANLECRVIDTRLVGRYNMFILEVVQAWINRGRRRARTLHHQGYGKFTVDGDVIRVRSNKP